MVRGPFPAVLHDRHFRLFWVGQTVSLVGDQVTLLAMPLAAVLVLHAGPAQMGALVAVGQLPSLILSLWAGAWLDRRGGRRRVMIAADLGRAGLLATLPAAAWLGVLTLAHLYAVAFLVGCLDVLFFVAYTSVFATMVRREHYVSATSLLNGSRAGSELAGQSLAGVLVAALSAPSALLVDAFSFVVSGLFLARIKPPEAPAAAAGSAGLLSGARWITRSRIVGRLLLVSATLNLFNFVFHGVFVLYAVTRLGIGPAVLGLVLGIAAAGAVAGAVAASWMARRIGLGWTYALSCVAFPAPLLIVPLAPAHSILTPLLVGLAELLSGFGLMLFDIGSGSLMAGEVPPVVRARVAGAYRTVNYGVRPLGAVVGGVIGALASVHLTVWIGAAGATVCGVWLLGSGITGIRSIEPERFAEPSAAAPVTHA